MPAHLRRLPRFAMRTLLALSCVGLVACDPGGGGDGGGGTGGGEPPEQDASLPTVPYEGEIAALPAGAEVDEQSFYPTPEGATWRYRKFTDVLQDLPPVTEGGESIVRIGAGENEFVKRTVVVIDLRVDEVEEKVRQVIEETYVVIPSDELIGPEVRFKALEIEERTIEGERFVRTVSRTYDPPYPLFFDTWKTGLIGTDLRAENTQLTEVVQVRGEEEPREQSANVTVQVVTDTTPKALPIEGMYRDPLFKVDVTDDFTNTISRTYWVQQGVGTVQWQYRDTNNVIYTLTENNVEGAGGEGEGEGEGE